MMPRWQLLIRSPARFVKEVSNPDATVWRVPVVGKRPESLAGMRRFVGSAELSHSLVLQMSNELKCVVVAVMTRRSLRREPAGYTRELCGRRSLNSNGRR